MRVRGMLAMAALCFIACGGGSGALPPPAPPVTVAGTVEGQPFSAQDAISFTGTGALQGFAFEGMSTVVSFGGLCGSAQGGAAVLSPTMNMALALVNGAADATPAIPGTYQVVQRAELPSSSGLYADVLVEACNGTGTSMATMVTDEATSGTVTVDAVDDSHVAGSVDLYFGQDHVSGSFDAPTCTDIEVTTVPVCQ